MWTTGTAAVDMRHQRKTVDWGRVGGGGGGGAKEGDGGGARRGDRGHSREAHQGAGCPAAGRASAAVARFRP
ncbi:hypothetical protein SLA2020_435370 [Shorea laevis]